MIKPVHKRLRDADHLTRVFSGNAVPSSIESKRLLEVVKILEANCRHNKDLHHNVAIKLEQFNDTTLLNLASEPKRIMLLERYLRDIERSIERKMNQLIDIQGLGSFRENTP